MSLEKWLLFWEIIEGFGTVVVAVCVAVEYRAEFLLIPRGKARRHTYVKRATFLLIVGLAIELFAHAMSAHISGLQTAVLNKEAGDARKAAAVASEHATVVEKEAALANERAGIANKIAGQANERAAVIETKNAALSLQVEELRAKNKGLEAQAQELEEQIIQTSNDLAKVDPLNRPINSMRADVFIVIRATNEFEAAMKKLNGQLNPSVTKSLTGFLILPKGFTYGKDSALGSLGCKEYESAPYFRGGTEYSMSFSWPSGDIEDTVNLSWIATNRASATELDKAIGSVEIFIPGVTNHSEIADGSCILTINGSIQKRFSIPKYTDKFWVSCLPITTNNPVVK